MNLGVDLLGIQSVASVIRQSKLPRFFITRYEAGKGSTPLFEVSDSTNVETAVKRFIEWGNTVLLGNPNNDNKYEIVLHEKDYENLQEEELQTNGVPKRDRLHRVRFSFMLRQPMIGENTAIINGMPKYMQPQYTPLPPPQQIDTSKYISVDEFNSRLQEKLVLEKMRMELEALKKERKEEEEEEEEQPSALTKIGSLMLERLFPIAPVSNPNTNTNNVAINGFADFNDDELDRIDAAIDKMRKIDPEIILHLEKLANISEKNPQQFMGLISMLNNF